MLSTEFGTICFSMQGCTSDCKTGDTELVEAGANVHVPEQQKHDGAQQREKGSQKASEKPGLQVFPDDVRGLGRQAHLQSMAQEPAVAHSPRCDQSTSLANTLTLSSIQSVPSTGVHKLTDPGDVLGTEGSKRMRLQTHTSFLWAETRG